MFTVYIVSVYQTLSRTRVADVSMNYAARAAGHHEMKMLPILPQKVTAVEASLEGIEPLVAHTVVERSRSVVRPLERILVVGTLAHRCDESPAAVGHRSSDGACARFASVPIAR
jgi:hypothetical protein